MGGDIHFPSSGESLKHFEKPDRSTGKSFQKQPKPFCASKEPVDPALVEVVRLSSHKKVKQALAHFLPYFQFLAK